MYMFQYVIFGFLVIAGLALGVKSDVRLHNANRSVIPYTFNIIIRFASCEISETYIMILFHQNPCGHVFNYEYVISEVLSAVNVKISVSLDISPRSLIEHCEGFRGICFLHIQELYHITRGHIPEENNLDFRHLMKI
jgi:hypothetical protein